MSSSNPWCSRQASSSDQSLMIAHLGASLMFGKTIISDAVALT